MTHIDSKTVDQKLRNQEKDRRMTGIIHNIKICNSISFQLERCTVQIVSVTTRCLKDILCGTMIELNHVNM